MGNWRFRHISWSTSLVPGQLDLSHDKPYLKKTTKKRASLKLRFSMGTHGWKINIVNFQVHNKVAADVSSLNDTRVWLGISSSCSLEPTANAAHIWRWMEHTEKEHFVNFECLIWFSGQSRLSCFYCMSVFSVSDYLLLAWELWVSWETVRGCFVGAVTKSVSSLRAANT